MDGGQGDVSGGQGGVSGDCEPPIASTHFDVAVVYKTGSRCSAFCLCGDVVSVHLCQFLVSHMYSYGLLKWYEGEIIV